MKVDLAGFQANGFIRLPVLSQQLVDAGIAWVWEQLGEQGVSHSDCSTWQDNVMRLQARDVDVFDALATAPDLASVLDALVGSGRWEPIANRTAIVRFPSPHAPPDTGWHIEGNWHNGNEFATNLWSRGRALFVMCLLNDTGADDAPMGMIAGSHLLVPSALKPFGEDGRGGNEIVKDLDPSVLCRRATYATGSAGDAYLCHPFLLHTATWPHTGVEPRVGVVLKVEMAGSFDLDGSDASPVAQSIMAGLTAIPGSGG